MIIFGDFIAVEKQNEIAYSEDILIEKVTLEEALVEYRKGAVIGCIMGEDKNGLRIMRMNEVHFSASLDDLIRQDWIVLAKGSA